MCWISTKPLLKMYFDIPVGTTREGPVRENKLTNLMGLILFNLFQTWYPGALTSTYGESWNHFFPRLDLWPDQKHGVHQSFADFYFTPP